MCLKHGSLFSGIGGFDLASEWIGWDNVFHCEKDEFCQTILNHYWPNAISYEDIKETDFTIWRGKVDVLTGGFPCQPYSSAGQRLGTEDDRHLWPEMLRAIREIHPSWVVGENVRGIITWNSGLVFNEVQDEMEAEGYDILPFLLPASSVDAPHERYRTFFIAHSDERKQRAGFRGDKKEELKVGRQEKGSVSGAFCGNGDVANTNKPNAQRGTLNREGKRQQQAGWKEFGRHFQYAWKDFPTEYPICSGNDGFSKRLDRNPVHKGFKDWRKKTLMAYGNAVVPQLIYQIFKTIEHYEQNRI